jgi:oligopeptide transport system substrate-binding protein
VDNVLVRRALSYALDRDTLTRTVMQETAIPAYSITPPDTLGYNPPKLFDYDPAKARELLAEAGYPDGEGWPGLEIIYNTQEAHRKIAVAVQQMWKRELNIDVTISNQEWKVYLNSVSQREFQGSSSWLDRRLRRCQQLFGPLYHRRWQQQHGLRQ